MTVHHISENNSILNQFLSEIRDPSIQGDRMRFRRNMERIGEVLGYELSKNFSYSRKSIPTPLGRSKVMLPQDDIVICSILRAGIPLHNGLLNYLDTAGSSFISAYRHHTNGKEFEIRVEYLASPSLEGKTLVLADPMLATGGSFLNVFKALEPMGVPSDIHLVCVIGARPGIDFLDRELPEDSHLWIAAIDEELDDRGYIVPGLGDAGDLSFGTKLQH